MGTRQRAGDLGAADARRQVESVGHDIRGARLALGMSIAAAGRRGGMSPAQHGRIERGDIRRPTLDQVFRAARAVGLEGVIKVYPGSSPVRDEGQLVVLGRFERLLAPPLVMRREVALPPSRVISAPGMAGSLAVSGRRRPSARSTSTTPRPWRGGSGSSRATIREPAS